VKPVDILVIDDDATFGELLQSFLEEEGHHTAICTTPALARQSIQQSQPDLIILDTVLGPENGWRFLEELKGDPSTATIPVLVCSAAVRDVIAATDRLRAQGSEVLLKPFDLDELLEKIQLLLRQSSEPS